MCGMPRSKRSEAGILAAASRVSHPDSLRSVGIVSLLVIGPFRMDVATQDVRRYFLSKFLQQCLCLAAEDISDEDVTVKGLLTLPRISAASSRLLAEPGLWIRIERVNASALEIDPFQYRSPCGRLPRLL